MGFKIGDRVVVIRDDLRPEFVGAVTRITSELRHCARVWFSTTLVMAADVYETELVFPGTKKPSVYRPQDLELYRPDDRERVSWSECLWQPRKVTG